MRLQLYDKGEVDMLNSTIEPDACLISITITASTVIGWKRALGFLPWHATTGLSRERERERERVRGLCAAPLRRFLLPTRGKVPLSQALRFQCSTFFFPLPSLQEKKIYYFWHVPRLYLFSDCLNLSFLVVVLFHSTPMDHQIKNMTWERLTMSKW